MTTYEPVIGMECHAELLTESKMFCGCANEFGGAPNTRTCPVCLGLPSSLPTVNRQAVQLVLRTALALMMMGTFLAADAQVPAPLWHVGQQWRVQVPQRARNAQSAPPPADSTKFFDLYRLQVIGKRMLRFDEQDGNEHSGQVVPPETCWLVSVSPEPAAGHFGLYHLYFRIDDLSLREIVNLHQTGRRQGRWFSYSSGHVDDDDETKPALMLDRGPYRDILGPVFWTGRIFH